MTVAPTLIYNQAWASSLASRYVGYLAVLGWCFWSLEGGYPPGASCSPGPREAVGVGVGHCTVSATTVVPAHGLTDGRPCCLGPCPGQWVAGGCRLLRLCAPQPVVFSSYHDFSQIASPSLYHSSPTLYRPLLRRKYTIY